MWLIEMQLAKTRHAATQCAVACSMRSTCLNHRSWWRKMAECCAPR